MPAPDPMELIVAQAKNDSDKQIAFYRDHLLANVAAWRNHIGRYDRDALIQNCVKALMEGDNTREDLCYKVTVAIDMMARSQDIR